MSEYVSVEDQGRVRHLVLDRPEKRNAINRELVLELRDAAREALRGARTSTAWSLRGKGPRSAPGSTCSSSAASAGTALLRPFRRDCIEMVNLLEEMPKPVIAQIHGPCLGLGAEIALACDLRVMADDAHFGLPETKLGLIPDVGGSSRLPAVVGLGNAKELIMTGRTIGAQECLPDRRRQPRRARRPSWRRRPRRWWTSCWPPRRSRSGWRSGCSTGSRSRRSPRASSRRSRSSRRWSRPSDFREAGAAFMEKRQPRWTRRRLPGRARRRVARAGERRRSRRGARAEQRRARAAGSTQARYV